MYPGGGTSILPPVSIDFFGRFRYREAEETYGARPGEKTAAAP